MFKYLGVMVMVAALPMAAEAEVCREYTRTIMIGGKAQEGVGIACQQEDGSWRMQGSGEEVEMASSRPQVIERERVIVVEQEPEYRRIYRRPDPVFQISIGDFGYGRKRCDRGWRGRHWVSRDYGRGRGYGHGHGRGRGHGRDHGRGHGGRW